MTRLDVVASMDMNVLKGTMLGRALVQVRIIKGRCMPGHKRWRHKEQRMGMIISKKMVSGFQMNVVD